MPPAWSARSRAPQGYSQHANRPCSTARRKLGAIPYSSRTTWAKWRRSAKPAPTARSTLRPPVGTVTSPRRRRPWRISSRIRAMGAARVWPARATKSRSFTRAAAPARSVQTGGMAISRNGMPVQQGQQVQENAGGGPPDQLPVPSPVTDPGVAPLIMVSSAAPARRVKKALQRQKQQPCHFLGVGVKFVRVGDQAQKGGDAIAGQGGHRL